MPTSDYTPSVDELGGFMRVRTKTRFGLEVGTFNDDTRPTASEAEDMIQEALDEVGIAVGADLPDGPADDLDVYRRGAKSLVLLLSSMNVELSVAPEQVSDPRSPYAALERRSDKLRKALIEAVAERRGETGGGGEADTGDGPAVVPGPIGIFPPPGTTMRERY